MATASACTPRTEKKKTITIRLTESEHAEISEAVRTFGRIGRVAKVLLSLYATARREHGTLTYWPPSFGFYDGPGAATYQERASSRRKRDLCTRATPCSSCLAPDGTHRHGGICPRQEELIITPDGTILNSMQNSAKILGRNLFSCWSVLADDFQWAACSGEPLEDRSIDGAPRLWYVAPLFKRGSREPIAFRCTVAPAFE